MEDRKRVHVVTFINARICEFARKIDNVVGKSCAHKEGQHLVGEGVTVVFQQVIGLRVRGMN